MFRQNYHKILWRESTNEPIKEYNLTTVTYGTTAATYLSVKTLQQLAVDDETLYPIASKIVLNDFYVDDLMSGDDTIDDAIIAQNQLTRLLRGGGFNLRKWSSNNREILKNLPEESRAFSNIEISKDETVKTLGISWNPTSDTFEFKVNLQLNQKIETKRKVLSEVAKLFDPLGWLAPTIISAKILLQDLWLAGVTWDEPLPKEIMSKWSIFRNTLSTIEEIKIPRWTNTHQNQNCELHGFCDASEKAYAAVLYIKVIDQDRKSKITLLAAKTKVAPIKSKISLPRLELCGALLLAKLIKFTTKAMQIPDIKTYAWTDSTITLAWIRGQPNKFKTFVANRISEIHNRTEPSQWRHVRSEDNPADCASRGITPTELKDHHIWWNGPKWLKLSSEHWPNLETNELTTDLESKKKLIILSTTKEILSPLNELVQRCSTIRKLVSIIAYCKRYLHNLKHKHERKSGSLTTTELDLATKCLIKHIQTEEYMDDIKFYQQSKIFNHKSKIISLNPFIDEDNIIRVGGRLQQSSFGYNQTHPIIIPNCVVAKLFIEEAHLKTMHGGTSLTMALLRQKYWIINARNLIKQTVHKCLRCHRYNAKNLNQIMGNLPAVRVTPSRPFTHTGVDYAGPIQVRTSKGRGNKSHKGWIAIFICLATKAIHIELVSDLSSEGFLAAFKRFVSRRGLCSHIYSDNGTNFVGADKILQQELKRTILETQNAVTEVLAKDGTQWHFIPPASPHFGGLWEAGVKSIKHHLRRVIGETTLTFEEMTTMLTQIEACLNSRPLCPMTSDPTDLEVLTPGHFLIGSSLLSSPEPCLTQSSRLMRWQLVQKITQDFWAAWSSEYVSRMQQRPKWLTKQKNAEVGQLVLIKDEQFPPSRWPLGRIIKNHPGKDGLSRVVSIRTKDKEILRPIVKICPLPIKDNEDELPTNTNIKVNTITKNIKPTSSRTAKYEINPIIWMLTIIAVFTNVNSQQSSNYFTLQPFTSQPGIYFEHLGTTNMINNQWNIIVYYDLKNYQLEFEGYKNAVAQLTKLHDKLFVDMSIVLISQSILNQFEHHLSSMRAKNLILRSINKVNKTRTKRGLINAVGYVAHSLFGILDEDFAQQYEHEIKQIQSNEDHIFNLIKKQTSIVEATTNIIKKTEVTIQQQFKEFDEHIKGLSEDLQRMDEDLNKQEIIHQFSLLTMNTMLMMTNYEKTQDALTDLLLNIQNGKLPMQLLTYSQLDEQIEIIKANIPSDIKIPVINNPIEVFKLLSARARLFEEKIIIQIEVPLAQMDDFQLFHLIPVPTPHEDYFINILPSTKYLAVNLHRDHYYPLSESDFRDCITTKIDYWLCRQSHAVYNLKSNVSSCEVAILNHDEHSPTCHIEASKVTRTWIQLQKTNSWIYVFNQRYTVDIICNKTIMSSNLEGSGILHLQSNCIIKESTMQIKSNNLYSSQIQESFYPSTNLSEIVQKHKVRIHQAKYQVFSLNNSREIEDLENKISLQKELETRKITEISHHDIHQYVILYLLLAGVFLAGIIIAVKKKKKKTTRTRANYNVPPLNMT